MARTAQVGNSTNTVANIINAGAGFTLAGYTLVASDAAQIGDTYDPAHGTFTPAVVRLSDVQASIGDAIDVQLFTHYALGFNYDFGTASALFQDGTTGPAGVQNIQTRDDTDRTNWLILESIVNDMLSAGQGAVNIPSPIRTASNAQVTVTATDAKTFCNALKNNGASKLGHSWALKNQVMQAATVAAAQAIDITAGWPA